VGEPVQEAGGVMVTLAALCLASGLDMHGAGETELARISAPELVAKIRAKQAAKPKHSPLPTAEPPKLYRLLERGRDRIQAADEFLREDGVTWRTDPSGIFVGCVYEGNILLPARRAVEAAPSIQGPDHG